MRYTVIVLYVHKVRPKPDQSDLDLSVHLLQDAFDRIILRSDYILD